MDYHVLAIDYVHINTEKGKKKHGVGSSSKTKHHMSIPNVSYLFTNFQIYMIISGSCLLFFFCYLSI